MGRAKEAQMIHDENLTSATSFLVSVGTLNQCEHHGYYFDGDGDLERLWPIAMGERKKGDNGSVAWAGDLKAREFTDLLKEAYEDNSGVESCMACDKIERE